MHCFAAYGSCIETFTCLEADRRWQYRFSQMVLALRIFLKRSISEVVILASNLYLTRLYAGSTLRYDDDNGGSRHETSNKLKRPLFAASRLEANSRRGGGMTLLLLPYGIPNGIYSLLYNDKIHLNQVLRAFLWSCPGHIGPRYHRRTNNYLPSITA